jgi:hypothetical protein
MTNGWCTAYTSVYPGSPTSVGTGQRLAVAEQARIEPAYAERSARQAVPTGRAAPELLYPGRELNPYKHYCSQDFKSCVSTNSTTRAGAEKS